MQLVIWTGTIVAVLNILLALLWPQVGLDHQLHEGAWQGIFTQKNVCAEATLFLLSPAVALKPRGRYGQLLRAIYIFLCLLVVGMTQSRTGWAMTAIYLAFAGLLRGLGRFSRKDALPLAALLGAPLLAAVAVLIQFSSTLLAVAARSGSLSGRQQIWSAVTRSILNRPLGGYGFGAFWSLLNGEASRVFAATGWIVTGAHNGFLNLVLELGLLGMALVTLTFVQAFRHAGSTYYPGRSPYIDWCIGIVFLTLVYNLDERTLMATQYLPWMLYVLACAGLARAARDKAWTDSDTLGMEQG
jgi:O-antigen ligase